MTMASLEPAGCCSDESIRAPRVPDLSQEGFGTLNVLQMAELSEEVPSTGTA